MSKLSAGILAYRYQQNILQVLLVHPGGPFFKNKMEGAWSIPKGEYTEGEDPFEVAKREFNEETGNEITGNIFIKLSPVKLKSGKVIAAWAVEADFEKTFIKSNLFEMEWPPKSGKTQSFSEVDAAEWFTIEEARIKLNIGQVALVNEVENLLQSGS